MGGRGPCRRGWGDTLKMEFPHRGFSTVATPLVSSVGGGVQTICQYFNDGWTDFYKNIYLSWRFFENRKNSGLTPGQNDEPATR